MAEEVKKAVEAKNDNTNLILCWIFAPITSLIWMNDANAKLQRTAKMTLYFSLVMIAAMLVFGIVSVIPVVGLLSCCILPLVSIGYLVVVIMGIVAATKGEVYEIPVVKDWVK